MNFVRTKIPSHQALEVQHKLTFVWIRKKERKEKEGLVAGKSLFLNVDFQVVPYKVLISNFTCEHWEK